MIRKGFFGFSKSRGIYIYIYMAYEYPSLAGTVRLVQVGDHWGLYFAGRHSGNWPSPDMAAKAVARHQSGLAAWDRRRGEAPEDLLDWQPLGDSL